MILKASQRGSAGHLARHLLNEQDNEHVEVHEIRGFISDNLSDALKEAEMVAKGTRCKQFLFSVSLSPPELENVSTEAFETAVEMVEQKLGLDNQPRAIVFHEKEGRRHAHAVWSRIDCETMTARTLPYFKNRLMDVSRELYLENNWDMPKGMIDRELPDPLNMTRAVWEQAKRTKQDPRLVKAAIRTCWESSDSAEAFKNALEERGYFLAKGNRRSYVAVDIRGEALSLTRTIGIKNKELQARLGDRKALPTITETKKRIAERMTSQLRKYLGEVETSYRALPPSLEMRRQQMAERHAKQRKELEQTQTARWSSETATRVARLPNGFRALWGRVTGKFNKTKLQNELEAWECLTRDRQEKDKLIANHLSDRQYLQMSIQVHRKKRAIELQTIQFEIAQYIRLGRDEIPEIERFNELSKGKINPQRDCTSNFDPDLEID